MSNTSVAIASDHAGYPLKAELVAALGELGYTALDLGADGAESVDYPDYGQAVADAVAGGRAALGVIVCGTGLGIAMAANRVAGIRAAPCWNTTAARLARQHNDANVLALGARLVGSEVARDCLAVFLETAFEGGRHQRRVAKLG